jgi:hypothetical protein
MARKPRKIIARGTTTWLVIRFKALLSELEGLSNN